MTVGPIAGDSIPRVINVDGNPSYPSAVSELKRTGELGRCCRCRPVRYLNNIVEQDHRAIKRRARARTIQGIEILKVHWVWSPKRVLRSPSNSDAMNAAELQQKELFKP